MNDIKSCGDFREAVARALDRDARELPPEWQKHAAECAECRNRWDQMLATEQVMSDIVENWETAPARLHAKIMSVVSGEERIRRLLHTRRVALWAAAALILVGVGVPVLLTRNPAPAPVAPRPQQTVAIVRPTPGSNQPRVSPNELVAEFQTKLKEASTPTVIRTGKDDFRWLGETILSTAKGAADAFVPEQISDNRS